MKTENLEKTKIKPKQIKKLKKEGNKACVIGMQALDCPYPAGSVEARYWHEGYDEAIEALDWFSKGF